MFTPIDSTKQSARQAEGIGFRFNGRELWAETGDTVAAALLRNGVNRFRKSVVTGSDRGPFCLMGACFECLVVINGTENQQACLRLVEDGMRIETQYRAHGTTGGEEMK